MAHGAVRRGAAPTRAGHAVSPTPCETQGSRARVGGRAPGSCVWLSCGFSLHQRTASRGAGGRAGGGMRHPECAAWHEGYCEVQALGTRQEPAGRVTPLLLQRPEWNSAGRTPLLHRGKDARSSPEPGLGGAICPTDPAKYPPPPRPRCRPRGLFANAGARLRLWVSFPPRASPGGLERPAPRLRTLATRRAAPHGFVLAPRGSWQSGGRAGAGRLTPEGEALRHPHVGNRTHLRCPQTSDGTWMRNCHSERALPERREMCGFQENMKTLIKIKAASIS